MSTTSTRCGVLELGDGFADTLAVVDPWHHLLPRRVQQ